MKHFLFTSVFLVCHSLFSQGTGYLGISMETIENKGVRISDVLTNGAAETYGLVQNDIIVSIDGNEVRNNQALKHYIQSKQWGETIILSFWRNGFLQSKEVILGNRAKKVTYEVRRTKKNNQVLWEFDNSTWICIENGIPSWIKKQDGPETSSQWMIEKGAEIPQGFLDLTDKLEIIAAINKRNEGKKIFPTITVYIKTYPADKKRKFEKPPQSSMQIQAFPNPSLGEFQFTLSTKEDKSLDGMWQVIDISGKIVKEGNLGQFEKQVTQSIDLSPQGAGVYLLKVVSNNKLFTERLVVK